jgi:ribosome silencing factor RsfS/YbeB/iojap
VDQVGSRPAPDGRRIIARKPNAETGKTTRATAAKPLPALSEVAKAPGTPAKKAAAAGPRASRAKTERTPLEPSKLETYLAIITTSLEDDKAEDVVVLDLTGRTSFADRMVIATGLADRQISAMAAHLEDKLEEAGARRIRIEGAGGSDWVLMDAGDIVVHLFKPEARALYALERMWGRDLDEPAPEDPAIEPET